MKVGYTRVSTKEQEAGYQDQMDRLAKEGCERIFAEMISGKTMERPKLQEMLDYVREGDVVVGTKIDRMFRNLRDLIEIHDALAAKNIGLVILDFGVDTKTPVGRMLMQILGAVAELEPNLMRERQAVGIERAKAEGRYAKRHRGYKDPVRKAKGPQNLMRRDYEAAVLRYARVTWKGKPLHNYKDIAELVGCSRATVHRILSDHNMIKKRGEPNPRRRPPHLDPVDQESAE